MPDTGGADRVQLGSAAPVRRCGSSGGTAGLGVLVLGQHPLCTRSKIAALGSVKGGK